jgi:hypothetical protein
MGADLLIAGMAAPWHWGRAPWEYQEDIAREVGHRRIDAFPLEHHQELVDELAQNLGLDDDATGHGAEDDAEQQALISRIRGALHEALNEVLGERRDVSAIEFGGRTYWLTGGLSWGDSPTEAFDAIAALDSIKLFDEPIPTPLA